MPLAEVGVHGGPPLLHRKLSVEGALERFVRFVSVPPAAGLEVSAHAAGRPVARPVRRVLKHLPDDLTPDAGVGAALDFHESRHTVLVDEQMVKTPPAGCVRAVSD